VLCSLCSAEKVTERAAATPLRAGLLVDWWAFLKENHRILSIFTGKDTVFTRPERIMVISLFFLFTMAVNCFLFIFRGNANDGETPGDVVWSQVLPSHKFAYKRDWCRTIYQRL